MNKKRIIYLGTPSISARALETLIACEAFDIVGVISKPDQPLGRKKIMTPSPVSKVALVHGIPLHRPLKLNKDYEFIERLEPDLLLTFAYGQIISTKVLALSKYKPLNVHASLLPKYRGAAPIQYAIRNGEKVTGISLMEMVKEMDAGDVYATRTCDITPQDTYTSLATKLSELASNMLLIELPKYFDNLLIPTSQDESLVTFCPSIKKEEEHIPLTLGPQEFVNYVHSLSDEPGGYLLLDEMMIKIFDAHVHSTMSGQVGQIVQANKEGLVINVSGGSVAIDLLQKPGKKVMNYKDFINGERNLLDKILK